MIFFKELLFGGVEVAVAPGVEVDAVAAGASVVVAVLCNERIFFIMSLKLCFFSEVAWSCSVGNAEEAAGFWKFKAELDLAWKKELPAVLKEANFAPENIVVWKPVTSVTQNVNKTSATTNLQNMLVDAWLLKLP